MSLNKFDKIELVLKYASHAPSSHNTQPWLVKLNDDKLIIGYNRDRYLTVADPNKRELFISLGCFIESIVLAGEDIGFKTDVKFIGDLPNNIVSIDLQPGQQGDNWVKLLKLRRSDRRMYDNKTLEASFVKTIELLRRGNATIGLFSSKVDIDFLANMTRKATFETMSRQDFREELAGWVRNNWTKKPDGMPGYTQGMPGPVSLIAKLVIKKNGTVAKKQAKKDSQRISESNAIGLIQVKEESIRSWVDAGRLYQLVCLVSLKNDVKTSAISAAVIQKDTSKEISRHLQLAQKPVALVRLGYKKGIVKPSPRLKLKDFFTS